MARRKFTQDEMAQLEGYAAIRLPIDQMAPLFGYKSERDFREQIKKSDEAQRRIALGKAKSSTKFRKTLYEMCTVDRNPRLIEFWAKTQEGFKVTEVIEHTGLNGGAISIRDADKDVLIAEYKRLQSLLDEK